MVIERKEFLNRNELQIYLNQKGFKNFVGYDLNSGQKLQEIIDHEKKKTGIKAIIVLR